MAIPVSDLGSNADENIAHAAKVIGSSAQRRVVFNAIYTGKKKVKTVAEIADSTGLDPKRIFEHGKKLASNHIVEQVKEGGRVAYKKIDFFHSNKSTILKLVVNPTLLQQYPTKRTPRAATWSILKLSVPSNGAKTKRITVDDIDSFARVHCVNVANFLSNEVSESQFKRGIQSILNETGEFHDWGGEQCDLWSTRLTVGRKRLTAAFAFKGPGTRGKLTLKKMGKNADQIQRLFQVSADSFIVQYRAQIDHSILVEMEAHATLRSVYTRHEVLYGIIDGIDSHRLYSAYGEHFLEET